MAHIDPDLLAEFCDRVVEAEEDRVLGEHLVAVLADVHALTRRAEAVVAIRQGPLGQDSREVVGWVAEELAGLAAVLERGVTR